MGLFQSLEALNVRHCLLGLNEPLRCGQAGNELAHLLVTGYCQVLNNMARAAENEGDIFKMYFGSSLYEMSTADGSFQRNLMAKMRKEIQYDPLVKALV